MLKKILLVTFILVFLMSGASLAEDFDWKTAEGEEITVLLNQHTYALAVEEKIEEFEEKTGIEVNYTIIPEENYFDKLNIYLNSRGGTPDVFMTGAYQVWDYAPAGYVQDLDEFINDSSLTSSEYNVDDFYDGILGSLRWDMVPGHQTGTGSLWALPMGFEQYTLAYNKRIFEEHGVEPPRTMEELMEVTKELDEFDGKNTYALALRGSRNWATIHPGYMTTFANYGAEDLVIEDDKLVSKVNSENAIKMTEDWVKLIQDGGAPNWSSYTWYQAGADLGAGKAAMMFDADIVQYFQNPEGASKEAGNLAWVPAPLPEGVEENQRKSNLWVWSMAMNEYSKSKEASWLFLQYFTSKEYQLWAAKEAKAVNPARESVFEDSEFQEVISKADGYIEAFNATVDGTQILFTPQPKFFELTTEWAATLQRIVSGNYESTEEGMNELKNFMDESLRDVEIE